MTVAAAGPWLTSFDAQPQWMVVLKAAFLLLTAMFMLRAGRRLLGRMQNRPGSNRAGPFEPLQSYADAITLALR
jgi:NADH-quinone oxidoreductase subunit H